MVRALAFHQCGPGSIPGPGVMRGLSLLLILFLTPRAFLPAFRFSSLHKKLNISKFQFDLDVKCLHMSPWLGRLGDYSSTMTLNLIYNFVWFTKNTLVAFVELTCRNVNISKADAIELRVFGASNTVIVVHLASGRHWACASMHHFKNMCSFEAKSTAQWVNGFLVASICVLSKGALHFLVISLMLLFHVLQRTLHEGALK